MRQTCVFMMAAALAATGCRKHDSGSAPAVAATNSYLEAAVKDLLGAGVPVLRLAGPGMCPGHFDMRPSQVSQLRRCRLLLRLDFQESLDARLAHLREGGLSVVEVRPPGGLGEPASYLASCRQVADALVQAGLAAGGPADARLAEITDRVGATGSRCRGRVRAARLEGTPVVASVHQEGFCGWLGLDVVSSFKAADVDSPRRFKQAATAGRDAAAKLVVANLPEGTRAARAIAERLGGRIVVFGNFPDVSAGRPSFDDLVTSNVARLLEAAGR